MTSDDDTDDDEASAADLAARSDDRTHREAVDRRHMRRCLALARRAEGRTSPNPIVGCVIVGPDGAVLAEGWHERAGEPHAEAVALQRLASAGRTAAGGTLYVNLEPCAHTAARRTAPCTPLLVASGIRRLVFGMHDPFPGHGGGLETLRAAGITVDGPVLETECRRANAPFVVLATAGRAHVTLKAAASADGKIATRTGQSRWITGERARAHAHRLRDRVDAILVGVATVVSDDPQLTTRGVVGGRDAVRLILDGRLRTPPTARVFHTSSKAPTIVVATTEAPLAAEESLRAVGADVWRLPGEAGRVDLAALTTELARRDLCRLLVEGGGDTHAAFVRDRLVDRLLLYLAPTALGGRAAPGWLGGDGVATLTEGLRLRWVGRPRPLGEDLLLEALRPELA